MLGKVLRGIFTDSPFLKSLRTFEGNTSKPAREPLACSKILYLSCTLLKVLIIPLIISDQMVIFPSFPGEGGGRGEWGKISNLWL